MRIPYILVESIRDYIYFEILSFIFENYKLSRLIPIRELILRQLINPLLQVLKDIFCDTLTCCMYIQVVFIFLSGSVKCEFLPLQYLLTISKRGVRFLLRGSHLILEWGMGFPLPWGDVGVGIHSSLFPFNPHN